METRITVRIGAETRKTLDARAKSQGVKLSEVVRQILDASTLSDKREAALSDKPKVAKKPKGAKGVGDVPAWKVKLLQQQEEMKHKKTRST